MREARAPKNEENIEARNDFWSVFLSKRALSIFWVIWYFRVGRFNLDKVWN